MVRFLLILSPFTLARIGLVLDYPIVATLAVEAKLVGEKKIRDLDLATELLML